MPCVTRQVEIEHELALRYPHATRGTKEAHVTRATVCLLLTLQLCGCSFDRRRDVAYDVLYKADGRENDLAFSAALAQKFPAGSDVSSLRAFTKSANGECTSKEDGVLACEIATRGKFCQARLIRIEATLNGDLIQSLNFKSGGLGC
jgi:hypothetical protein